jgi:hypothetical protein
VRRDSRRQEAVVPPDSDELAVDERLDENEAVDVVEETSRYERRCH